MTQRKTTNNPIPSNALADLSDNTIILEEWTNGSDDYTVDRFGNKFKTRKKILDELQTAVEHIQSGSFLLLSGGTVNGDVNVKGRLQQNGTDVFNANGGEITGNVNVNGNGKLQQNGIDVLKVGDGGLFSESPWLTAGTNLTEIYVEKNNIAKRNQIFYVNGVYAGMPWDKEMLNGFLTVKRSDDFCLLTYDDGRYKYVQMGWRRESAWRWNIEGWVEQITTSNISKYAGKAVITNTYLSEDGLSWYRKYSDGWIEQGGVKTGTFNYSTVHNLITPFTNTNYTILIDALYKGVGSTSGAALDKSTSTFKNESFRGNTGNVTYSDITWYACGF